MNEGTGLHAIEVYMMISMTLIRICTISTKYSYQSERALRLLYKRKMTSEELNSGLLLSRWWEQTDELIQQELQTAILRLEIDSSSFFFTFLGIIPKDPQCKPEKRQLTERLDFPIQQTEMHEQVNNERDHKSTMLQTQENEILTQDDLKTERSTSRSPIRSLKSLEVPYKSQNQIGVAKTGKWHARPSIVITKVPAASEVMNAFSHFLDAKKLEEHKLYGYSLMLDLINHAKSRRYNYMSSVVLCISLIRALLPTLYRIYTVCYRGEKNRNLY